jgi:hypothetical protein
MTRSLALGALVISSVLVAAAYVAAIVSSGVPSWAPWALMVGTSTIMLATMVLGASRARGGVGKLAVPFVIIFAILIASFSAALSMPAESASSALWLGLPPRAAVILYGIGVFPLFLLPIAYAVTFETLTLSDDDLARVRAARAQRS